jgi:hypothetical protein
MGEIVKLWDKFQRPPNNLIISSPWEFRRADWEGPHFIQMLRSQSVKLECHREEVCKKGGKGIWHLPSHFSLKGGMIYTVLAMYAHRNNENRMRQVYYLTGLIDCMINQVNPVLRTDLLKAMYKKVFSMKTKLNVHWCGPLDHVLLPIGSRFFNENEYRALLKSAQTMKELYRVIRIGTEEMFDVLSLEYVFYCPGARG